MQPTRSKLSRWDRTAITFFGSMLIGARMTLDRTILPTGAPAVVPVT